MCMTLVKARVQDAGERLSELRFERKILGINVEERDFHESVILRNWGFETGPVIELELGW